MATQTKDAAQAKEAARNKAIAGGSAGLALVISGLAYMLAGPTGTNVIYGWFTGSVIVGVCLVFLSVVSYFTFMEHQDPAHYAHEVNAPVYEGERG